MTTVDAITKEIYQGRIRNQLQDEQVGYKRIEQTSEGVETQVGGKYVTFPIRVKRNHGQGYRNENEQLPAAGQQGYASVRIGLKNGYGRVRMTGQTMELAESNYQAFASAMDQEMNGLKDDIAKDTNRVFYGSNNGTMATITADGVNTVTVSNTQYLEVGMQIDIMTPGSSPTTKASNRQITAINTTTGVVTYDGADATAAVNDVLVRTGSINREPNGLGSLVTSTGILFNVDPAVEPKWAATIDDNAGVDRPLSEALFILNTDRVRIQGGKTSLILVSLGVRRAYFNLLTQQRKFTNTTTFAGGFEGLEFHNGRSIPVVEDVDCPPKTAFLLDESSFKIYRDKPWFFLNKDGSIWKWVHDFDAFEAVMAQYWEIGINRRNANAKITNITEA